VTSLIIRKGRDVFETRQADESDIPNLVELDDECFDTYYYSKTKFSEADFRAYLSGARCILLVAARDSGLVGYVAGTIRTSRFRSIAHLDSIAVSWTARNEGVGGHLLDLFIQGAKQQACQIVLLEVAEANEDGLDFFSNRGFQRIGDLPEYYGRGLDGTLMQLSI
jgi:ribosomal protein S18 acetylase RimI-like enzyme